MRGSLAMLSLPTNSIIYISGPMTGHRAFNFKNFFHWQVVLERAGYIVINPAEIDTLKLFDGWQYTEDQWEELIEEDCRLIREHADAVFVLKGYEGSRGATREIAEALRYTKPCFYENEV